MQPLIALLTDFGTRDPYAAQVRGVIVSRCDATLVDLTHEIAPFDIFEAAMFLRASVDVFPAAPARTTIFVCVVDPGVGSARRILAAFDRGRLFLAPDNGLLDPTLSTEAAVRSVESTEFFLPTVATTFHGRDRFAPVAAALASGAPIETLGPAVARDSIVRLLYTPPEYENRRATGTVIAIDRFGNLITDLEHERTGEISARVLRVGHHRITHFGSSYAAMTDNDEPFMIWGSRGTLEVSVANGSAASLLQIARSDRIELEES